MKLTTFNRLMKNTGTKRHPLEWKWFLEFCDLYLRRKIRTKNPTVMEVGESGEAYCKFYEKLFTAKCVSSVYQRGLEIDILSISGGSYREVKRDFEKYSPHCNGIIAIHDIERCRYKQRKASEAWRFWDELKLKTSKGEKAYENFLFIAIHKKRIRGNQRGIGVIIKQ